jgi:hypothetical protein
MSKRSGDGMQLMNGAPDTIEHTVQRIGQLSDFVIPRVLGTLRLKSSSPILEAASVKERKCIADVSRFSNLKT